MVYFGGMVRETKKHKSNFWALMTIAAFPIAMLSAMSANQSTLAVFAWGILATIAVLTANALSESRLWMFSPEWKSRFDHPEFSFRLAVVAGALLLVLQTSVLVMLFTDGGLDRNMLRIVFKHQCTTRHYGFDEFCRALEHDLNP